MSFTKPFLPGPVFYPTAFPCYGSYHLERGVMPLHDAVGISIKRPQLLKIKAQMSSIWAKGCMLMIVVCLSSDLTILLLFGGGLETRYMMTILNRIDNFIS